MSYGNRNDPTDRHVEEGAPFGVEGYQLMAAVFEVYNSLGFGLAEEVYQEALELERKDRAIPFVSKPPVACHYKGRPLQKRYFPDLIVFHHIIVELKAISALGSDHEGQLLNYLRLTRRPIGYLVNFGRPNGTEWKRFIISEHL